MSSFGRGSPKEYSCEIILKLGQWPWRRCHLKVFLFLALGAILFSGAELLGNFGRGYPKEHSCKIISKSVHWFRRRCLLSKLLTDEKTFKGFSIFRSGGYLVHLSRMVRANFCSGSPKEYSFEIILKYFGLGRDVVLRFFYF